MIVLQVNVDRVLAFKGEGQTPVARDGNGVAPGFVAGESVEAVGHDIHVLGARRLIQERQSPLDFADLIRAQPEASLLVQNRLSALLRKLLIMPTLYHAGLQCRAIFST